MKRLIITIIIISVLVIFSGCDLRNDGEIKTIKSKSIKTETILDLDEIAEKQKESLSFPEEIEKIEKIEEIKKQVELLNEEHIGFLELGEEEYKETSMKLSSKLGSSKFLVSVKIQDGIYQRRIYTSKGIDCDMFIEFDGYYTYIYSIKIYSPCDYTTNRGIGIGSSRDEVLGVYEDEIEDINSEKLIAGSTNAGIIFKFHDNVVEFINLRIIKF